MKLYKYLISGGLALTLSLSSCESWLEVEPNDTRTTDYFYSTPSEMEQAIIGIYNGLLPISDYSWLMSEVRSDNAWVDKTTDKQRDYIDIGTFNPNISTISTLSGAWNNLYEIIARANMFLSKTDGVTFSSEAIKNQFIGEAKFLRALAYFDLVRYFGRIPIVLEPVSVNEAMTIKQSEPVEVYETAIVPDLEDAVKKLVDTPLNYMGNSASAGRATQVAAKSLLGRVYLTMAGYPVQDASKKALAEELFSEVIDYSFANNKYWASTADEWIKIWISDNDNKYHIFEIQYIAAKNYGNPMVFNSVPAVNDSYTKIQMSGNRIWCENQLDGIFKQTDETGAFIDKRCAGTINTSEFVDEDGTPYTGGDFFLKFFEHKMKRKLLGYEDIDDQTADRTYFPINYPLIRLEDVMLMYAEIVGPTGKGKEMVNKIRTRAGLDALDDDITIENFADSVDIERRRELASEGIRWHDLVRQDRYVSVLQDMFKRNGSDANGVITKPETYELYKLVTKDSYIYPIPDSQMKVKEGLYEQNKGYN